MADVRVRGAVPTKKISKKHKKHKTIVTDDKVRITGRNDRFDADSPNDPNTVEASSAETAASEVPEEPTAETAASEVPEEPTAETAASEEMTVEPAQEGIAAMTDRVRHLTITLDEDIDSGRLESIVSAIQRLHGVARVVSMKDQPLPDEARSTSAEPTGHQSRTEVP